MIFWKAKRLCFKVVVGPTKVIDPQPKELFAYGLSRRASKLFKYFSCF
jgi:hypothetical protein